MKMYKEKEMSWIKKYQGEPIYILVVATIKRKEHRQKLFRPLFKNKHPFILFWKCIFF